MFTSARIKLTVWYLLIVMTVSMSFSAFIYQSVTSEFKSRLGAIERRLELPGGRNAVTRGQALYFAEELDQTRTQIFYILLYVNGVIFIFSAFASYYLAGKTLSPIKAAMDEQKRFITDAGHELKTPLAAMLSASEVALRDRKLSIKDAKSVIKDNISDTEKLKKLTENLLSLSRLAQNNGLALNEKIDIKKVAKKSVKRLSTLAASKDIKIKLSGKTSFVRADSESLEKLFDVLIDNAVKYSKKKGTIEINFSKGRNCIIFRITDHGLGISKKDLPHVFDRFYRADKARGKEDGFGIGLSIAKQIVDLHGGQISVISRIGKGTTFKVKLPI